jgi:hypothetical protein
MPHGNHGKGAGARRSTSSGLRFRQSSPQRAGGGDGRARGEDGGGRGPRDAPAGASSPPRDAGGSVALPPPLDVDALVRGRYYAHVTSQVFLSNLPPWVRAARALRIRASPSALPSPLPTASAL